MGSFLTGGFSYQEVRIEKPGPDNTSRETFAMNLTDLITSTPMVTVIRETLAEVNTSKVAANDVVDSLILNEAAVIEEEEGGFNHHALPRAITGEPKATILAESRNDNVTFDLSRLSETNIDEVADASDETWLLSISSTESSTVKVMLGAGDTSGARALRSRSVNKDNTFEGVASARFFLFLQSLQHDFQGRHRINRFPNFQLFILLSKSHIILIRGVTDAGFD